MRLIPVPARAEFRKPRRTRRDKGRKRSMARVIGVNALKGAAIGAGATLLGGALGGGAVGIGKGMKAGLSRSGVAMSGARYAGMGARMMPASTVLTGAGLMAGIEAGKAYSKTSAGKRRKGGRR